MLSVFKNTTSAWEKRLFRVKAKPVFKPQGKENGFCLILSIEPANMDIISM